MIRAVRTWFRRHDQDLDAEMQAHLDLLAEGHLARGLSPDDAKAAACRDFGGVTQVREACRDARWTRWLDEARQGASYAVRTLRRAPGFGAAVVVTLAVGIGVNAPLFSLSEAVMFRPFPFADQPGPWCWPRCASPWARQ